MTEQDQTSLIALDWGTSSLRAFRMSRSGAILERRGTKYGIQNLPAAGVDGYEQAFSAICDGWTDLNVPIIAGGMVGSAQGWVEAPYIACPAKLDALCGKGSSVTTRTGETILIAPGLMYRPQDGAPDVMRGEEIQIAGTVSQNKSWQDKSLLVLPGTHSKWVNVGGNVVERFNTFMTGELFSLLCQHSILGRLMQDKEPAQEEAAEAAFFLGVEKAHETGGCSLTHQLFSVRTHGLMKDIQPTLLADYLSGLLIGHEIVSSREEGWLEGAVPLVLVGEDALCSRYAAALAHLSIPVAARIENPAPDGLFWLASAAGLLD